MIEWEKLREAVKKQGYTFFDTSVNLIGVRTDDVFDNKFSDWLHVAFYDESTKKRQVITIPWTTLAGTLGKGGVLKPVTAWGTNVKTGVWEEVTGVAILKEGQYRSAYEFRDTYVGWLNYPYFMQVQSVIVYRDNIIDLDIDREVVQHKGIFGINIHPMSNTGQASFYVNYAESAYSPNGVVWSMGCQGAIEPEYKKILGPVRADAKKYGNLFTYTLLHQNSL